ncbi:hypothetical protein PHLCEN_2v1151 [Hermanssonia centrifuga]|uniref:Uncharacterized protein n=1 Tax=Hermanssonia centrifuga TaxID=98765 RepID=A0A2R6S469_9APHY|nr:hypothetical protein PHLCEN_2v1151 [Hermanssonia centrifuga]
MPDPSQTTAAWLNSASLNKCPPPEGQTTWDPSQHRDDSLSNLRRQALNAPPSKSSSSSSTSTARKPRLTRSVQPSSTKNGDLPMSMSKGAVAEAINMEHEGAVLKTRLIEAEKRRKNANQRGDERVPAKLPHVSRAHSENIASGSGTRMSKAAPQPKTKSRAGDPIRRTKSVADVIPDQADMDVDGLSYSGTTSSTSRVSSRPTAAQVAQTRNQSVLKRPLSVPTCSTLFEHPDDDDDDTASTHTTELSTGSANMIEDEGPVGTPSPLPTALRQFKIPKMPPVGKSVPVPHVPKQAFPGLSSRLEASPMAAPTASAPRPTQTRNAASQPVPGRPPPALGMTIARSRTYGGKSDAINPSQNSILYQQFKPPFKRHTSSGQSTVVCSRGVSESVQSSKSGTATGVAKVDLRSNRGSAGSCESADSRGPSQTPREGYFTAVCSPEARTSKPKGDKTSRSPESDSEGDCPEPDSSYGDISLDVDLDALEKTMSKYD